MSNRTPSHVVIIPACNEAAALPLVLDELREVLAADAFRIAVGVNGSTDATAEIARAAGAIVAETDARGYGAGCRAAIDEVEAQGIAAAAYIFLAADGANDPRDIPKLVAEHRRGAQMALGCRTRTPSNWNAMNFHYVVANRFFGALCGFLTGRFFADLGPLRLIERELFHAMRLREWTYGWTIEAQVRAAVLGARIAELPVRERARIAGEQKVSHVSWRRTAAVGLHIIAAALRARNSHRYRSTAAGPARLLQKALR